MSPGPWPSCPCAWRAASSLPPHGRPTRVILGVDTGAQTITLSRTADTQLPGRYGLFTSGTESYLKLGSVLAEDATSVKRKLLTHIDRQTTLSSEAAFSGWYFDSPDQLHVPYTAELIGAAVGPCPAWFFPAAPAEDGGRRATRG